MRIVRTVEDLRAELAGPRRAQSRIGLVPTMGALHDGHLSLIRAARRECGVVVVSLFVNPAQFNERSDLERYPRDEIRDRGLARDAGADILFAPDESEVYPEGFSSFVQVLGLSERLEGAARGAEHFRGVCTVVTKLLCMAMPDAAYFGQKDAQQVLVIRRMAADLNLPGEIRVMPTVREADGLAMSSRNALLDPAERESALALVAGLRAASRLAGEGERSAQALVARAHRAMDRPGVEPEYVELVDPATLQPVVELDGSALLLIAARVGAVRLIDNAILEPARSAGTQGEAREEVFACSA